VKLHFTADSDVAIDKAPAIKGSVLAKGGIRGASV
jgi:hypothetical protein